MADTATATTTFGLTPSQRWANASRTLGFGADHETPISITCLGDICDWERAKADPMDYADELETAIDLLEATQDLRDELGLSQPDELRRTRALVAEVERWLHASYHPDHDHKEPRGIHEGDCGTGCMCGWEIEYDPDQSPTRS